MENGKDLLSTGLERIKRRWYWLAAGLFVMAMGILIPRVLEGRMENKMRKERLEMTQRYGENRSLEGKDYDRSLAAECANGVFVGKESSGVRAYKGIPFAKPPVGELRWKAAEEPDDSSDVYEAYYFGKSPIQTEADSERASFYPQGEDCLTLNIWTSDEVQSSGKNVMVFFPGGGYGWGGTADPIYDGQNFVEKWKDIVLVTANYRVGMMGFVDFTSVEGGGEYKEAGNLGMLDQVCALKWIHKNIRAFGGDPDKVTIFGESAGASSVSLLPLMKGTEGLFRRVIAESGSVAFTFSKRECQDFTKRLMKQTRAKNMDDLLALSEADLKKVNEKLNDYINFPERDGVILPEDLYAAWGEELVQPVDILSGTNADENRYWIGEVGGYPLYMLEIPLVYRSTVNRFAREDRRYAKEFMKVVYDKPIWQQTEFMNDLLFRVPAIAQAEAYANKGGKCYMYYWTKESLLPHYGACHAVELAYVFNNLDDTIFTGARADEKLADTVQKMWVNFAKTGDPSTDEYHWDTYDAEERLTMILGDEIELLSDPMQEQRELVEPLLAYRINGFYGMYDYVAKYLRKRILRGVRFIVTGGGLLLAIYGLLKKAAKRGKNR